ncbi:hypothetical protein BDY21DRAFT_15287 [Lineolata rhizophorae]|uniref:Uncharacterized protein n=1 Tax=Lineolata rhizophorae TaxID=578093 RepID=A0A6A6P0Z8_9PEZI|nr:hypothetical protein BDY21DRAFT_15287 [Lineolata rhizophorae]
MRPTRRRGLVCANEKKGEAAPVAFQHAKAGARFASTSWPTTPPGAGLTAPASTPACHKGRVYLNAVGLSEAASGARGFTSQLRLAPRRTDPWPRLKRQSTRNPAISFPYFFFPSPSLYVSRDFQNLAGLLLQTPSPSPPLFSCDVRRPEVRDRGSQLPSRRKRHAFRHRLFKLRPLSFLAARAPPSAAMLARKRGREDDDEGYDQYASCYGDAGVHGVRHEKVGARVSSQLAGTSQPWRSSAGSMKPESAAGATMLSRPPYTRAHASERSEETRKVLKLLNLSCRNVATPTRPPTQQCCILSTSTLIPTAVPSAERRNLRPCASSISSLSIASSSR